jgi:hypothetical protein
MKIYYVILAVFLSGNSYTQIKVEQTEQTQTAHQYIVQQAYQYLYSKLGRSIPVVENHLGNWETGSNYFNPGNKIVIGAYREDEEDIVYNNGWPNETITKYWLNLGIGKCYFGPTLKLGISYEYNQNIFSFRYLKADEFRFSAGGYNFDDPPLKFYEIAVLYGYPYRIHNMTIGLLAGIGYLNGIERGTLIQNRLYEGVEISQLSLPLELYFRIEPLKYLSLGITGFGNINTKRSFFGAMIELSIGNF